MSKNTSIITKRGLSRSIKKRGLKRGHLLEFKRMFPRRPRVLLAQYKPLFLYLGLLWYTMSLGWWRCSSATTTMDSLRLARILQLPTVHAAQTHHKALGQEGVAAMALQVLGRRHWLAALLARISAHAIPALLPWFLDHLFLSQIWMAIQPLCIAV